jgi:thiamine pyrophosphokinase
MNQAFKKAWLITPQAPLESAIPYKEISSGDLIIAIDGGLERCLQLRLKPQLFLGDLDSLGKEFQDDIPPNCQKIIYPTDKNETDTQLAIQYCIDHKINEIIICNDLGRRFDHSLAIIQNLLQAHRNGINTKVASENQILQIISGSVTLCYPVNTLLSLISITDQTEFISSSGLQYPLENLTLYNWQSRGISNVVTEPEQVLNIASGLIIAIITL